jgi:2'-5' RNA ligase
MLLGLNMTFRAFISVDLEPQPKLIEFWESLKGTNAPLKLVNLDIIHMTLKFLGDTEERFIEDIERIMIESIQDVRSFEVKLKGTGAFPNLNYMKVVWVGLEGAEPLISISKTLDRDISRLGFKKEKRGFQPHVTVARVKGPRNKDVLADVINDYKDVEFGVKRVDCLRLKKSVLHREGPIYSTVREIKFSE